jgi:hypothetical protein
MSPLMVLAAVMSCLASKPIQAPHLDACPARLSEPSAVSPMAGHAQYMFQFSVLLLALSYCFLLCYSVPLLWITVDSWFIDACPFLCGAIESFPIHHYLDLYA